VRRVNGYTMLRTVFRNGDKLLSREVMVSKGSSKHSRHRLVNEALPTSYALPVGMVVYGALRLGSGLRLLFK
jgi:hypothetical protein